MFAYYCMSILTAYISFSLFLAVLSARYSLIKASLLLRTVAAPFLFKVIGKMMKQKEKKMAVFFIIPQTFNPSDVFIDFFGNESYHVLAKMAHFSF